MATIAPAALVTGAARVPAPYGLFSTFTWRPAGADRWEGIGVEWESATCDPVSGIGNWQPPAGAGTVGIPKTLTKTTMPDATALPFTVYGHFRCSPVGWSPEDAQRRANEHLLSGEETRAEQAFWTGDLGNTPKLQDAGTTTLGGGALSLGLALGFLEQFIAAGYGNVGVIHMPRKMVPIAGALGMLSTTGGRLTTTLGTPVAAGSGYPGTGPTGQAITPTTGWMFVTPALFGYRSEVFTSSDTPGDLFDRSTNNLYAVAERSYLLGFDPCGVGAVLVDLAADQL
jgi:hypothetical protein